MTDGRVTLHRVVVNESVKTIQFIFSASDVLTKVVLDMDISINQQFIVDYLGQDHPIYHWGIGTFSISVGVDTFTLTVPYFSDIMKYQYLGILHRYYMLKVDGAIETENYLPLFEEI